MKIYLVRHGQTEWNLEGRMQGWKNSNLTAKGIENAKKLGEHLMNIDFQYAYCSPLGRAIETTNHIIGDKKTEVILCDYLREMSFGKWEGMRHVEVEELYAEQHFNLWNRPHLYEPMNGESFKDVIKRAKQALIEIMKNDKCENVLVVSHAILIKAIYAVVKDYSLEEFWNPPFMNDTCLTILEVKDGVINMLLEADTSHLAS